MRPDHPVGPPNLRGDLDSLLSSAPVLRGALFGYNRLQVDNYLAWLDTELRAAQGAVTSVLQAYARVSGELLECTGQRDELYRRLQQLSEDESPDVTTSLRRLLEVAAEEAQNMRAAASAEAEQIVREAREEADALLRAADAQRQRLDTLAAQRRLEEEQELAEQRARAERYARATLTPAEARLDALHRQIADLIVQRDHILASLQDLNVQLNPRADAAPADAARAEAAPADRSE